MTFWTHFAAMGERAASAGGWSSTQARTRSAWLGLVGATGGLTGNQASHSVSEAPSCHGICGKVHTETCTRSPGKDQVNEAAKGGKGGGLYFPLTAVQVRRPCRHAASCNAPSMHSLPSLSTACLSVSGVFQRIFFQMLLGCVLVALVDTLQGLSWQSLSITHEDKLTRAKRASAKVAKLRSERKAPMYLCNKWLW